MLQEQLREKNEFLKRAYEEACKYHPSGPLSVNLNPLSLGRVLGFSEDTTKRIMYELVADRYAESSLGMGSLYVTQLGLNYLRSVEAYPKFVSAIEGLPKGRLEDFENENDIITEVMDSNKSDIFVTYRWENEKHNNNVIALVNYLRENGYEATMDRLESQKETAKDFIKMMHQAMTDYPKVIIVLSEGYKTRADGFEGGVGSEYGLIIKDIDSNPRKYVLISFQEIQDSITPLNFKGREIIHLSDEESYNKLHAKLQDENLVAFSPVAKAKPIVKMETVANLHIPKTSIEILGFQANWGDMGTTMAGGKYVYVSYKLELILKNNSANSITDYTVEISMPKVFTEYTKIGKVRNSDVFITLSSNPKIYPRQEVLLEPIQLQIVEGKSRLAAESKILVKVYTETGIIEKYYPLMEFLFDTKYGEKHPLSLGDFA